MTYRVTLAEAQAELNRLISVFPRHGYSDEGLMQYAEAMAPMFAGAWHMRRVIDAARVEFKYFPSIAELRELTDRISASRPQFTGCDKCIRSAPGLAYTPALWSPGQDGRSGCLEAVTDEAATSIRPQIEAAIEHARAQNRDYNGQRLIERTDVNAAVGYCSCAAGVELRARHIAEASERGEKRGRGELRRAS